MEQERIDPEFQRIYDHYIATEKAESDHAYGEIAPSLTLPVRRVRWIYPVAAAVVILIAGTYALTSEKSPFRSHPKYTEAEVRESLEKAIHALSACSKTVRQEFRRVEDISAMSGAISSGKRNVSNTTKN